MKNKTTYLTITETIGNTPLVRLVRLPGEENARRGNVLLAKLEGVNPTGSVKDRAMDTMLRMAEARGAVKPGDTLIEATGGNAGISLAMIAARKGYRCVLVMPESTSQDKQQCMATYGAEIILTPKQSGMGFARSLVHKMVADGDGVTLDQYTNPDNAQAHYETTGPEIWQATGGRVTHVVGGLGTAGTLTGISRYLKKKNRNVQIIGVEPEITGSIPGIHKWSESAAGVAGDDSGIDRIMPVSLAYAEYMTRKIAAEEGIFSGLSGGAACEAAMRLLEGVTAATIVFVIGDRGERYLSRGVFQA